MNNEVEPVNMAQNNAPESAPNAPAPTPAPTPVTNPAPHAATSGLAIASLIVGIVALISGWVPVWGVLAGIAAVVLGFIALKKPGGKGMSIAGIITGGLGALTGLFVTTVFIIAIASGAAVANTAVESIKEGVSQADQEAQAQLDAKKDFAKGETAKFGDFEIKINAVTRDFVPTNKYSAAEEGKEFVILNLTIKNVSSDSKYVTSYDYTVDDNGVSEGSAYVTIEDSLKGGSVEPGASVTGNVAFEVTKGATGLKLQQTETVYVFSTGKSAEVVYTLAF